MELRGFQNSLLYSAGLHLLAALIFFFAFQRMNVQPSTPPRTTWIEVETPKSVVNPRIKNRIVQTAPGEKTDQAPDQAYLGERNQRVDRERIGKLSTSLDSSAQQRELLAGRKTGLSLRELGIPINTGTQREHAIANAPTGTGQSVPQEYIRGLKEGETTALNTREFVYFGYYQRIRARLDQAWTPMLKASLMKMYRTGRRPSSDMDHVTRVMVVLNQAGEITRVQIMSESGIRDLDQVAVSAFNLAGPFPNPPHGIVDRNGEIQIPWEFILKT